jgi:hypothetical protein
LHRAQSVDGCAGFGTKEEVHSDNAKLLQRFVGRVLGEIQEQVFLGILHVRDWEKGTHYLSQPTHIDAVLSKHGFAAGKAASTPMDYKVMLLPATVHVKKEQQLLSSYPATVGSIMYMANSTRPDLCYTASVLARFMGNPSDAHLEETQRLLHYLIGI